MTGFRFSYCFSLLFFSMASITATAAEIPINVGVGPSLFSIPDSIQIAQVKPFFGFNLKIKAIIDKETIEKNKAKIPPKFRSAVEKTNEVRIGYLYIPANIMIAPGDDGEQPSIYGATWKPISIDLPVKLGPATLSFGTELVVTYAMITAAVASSENTESKLERTTTHFIRPGLSLNAELDYPLSKAFVFSLGATSSYYIPQKLKGAGANRDSLWRVGEMRATLNYRFPIEVKL